MKTILATTDFSSSARAGVDYAAALAMVTQSKLYLMHATHIPIISDQFFDATVTLQQIEAADKESMQAEIKRLHKKYGSSLNINAKVSIGFTGELLDEMCSSGKISLVVMSLAHSDLITRTLFGSTVTSLAGYLKCPLLVVPERYKFKPFRRIAFAFDERPLPGVKSFSLLKEICEEFSSTMHFVHALNKDYPSHESSTLKPIMKYLKAEDSDIHYVYPQKNSTSLVLADWCRRYKINLTVLVSREHNLLHRLFKERMTKELAFDNKNPLLVISEKNS